MANPQKLQRTMKEHSAPTGALEIGQQIPTRPVVVDLTQVAEREAQQGNKDAANLVRACEAGVAGDNGTRLPLELLTRQLLPRRKVLFQPQGVKKC
jgi:hypothetical protein